jgi:hypothetical protein
VLALLNPARLSIEVLEYVFCSLAWLTSRDGDFCELLKYWRAQSEAVIDVDLFRRLFARREPALRKGAAMLALALNASNLSGLLVSVLAVEDNLYVRREILKALSQFRELPSEVAHSLLEKDSDWVARLYAARCTSARLALVLSDGTEFANELGQLASAAGFTTISTAEGAQFDEASLLLKHDALACVELVIFVRGEHYSTADTRLYSLLRDYVCNGGRLFATSWVSWVNKHHHELDTVLPVTHIRDTYHEDEDLTCGATASSALTNSLFPRRMEFRSSYELLARAENSTVICESTDGIPVFAYRRAGSGVCYYLNTCQHSCLGHMISPLSSSRDLHEAMSKTFGWIASVAH